MESSIVVAVVVQLNVSGSPGHVLLHMLQACHLTCELHLCFDIILDAETSTKWYTVRVLQFFCHLMCHLILVKCRFNLVNVFIAGLLVACFCKQRK